MNGSVRAVDPRLPFSDSSHEAVIQPFRLQTVERRVHSDPVSTLEQVFRGALNVPGDCVALGGSGNQGAEDQRVECALRQSDTGRGLTTPCETLYDIFCRVSTRDRAVRRLMAPSKARWHNPASRWPSMDLVLRLPEESEEDEFLRAHRATSPGVPAFFHYYEEGMSFRRYLGAAGGTGTRRASSLRTTSRPRSSLRSPDSRIVGRVSIPPLPQSVSRTSRWAHWLRRRPRVQAERLCDHHAPPIPSDCAPEARLGSRPRDL